MYKKNVLSNGIRVIAHPMAGRKSVALGIWIKAGGRYEHRKVKGVSHYLEHLLFKGSNRFSCHDIKELIEGVGGSLNGFTSEELTCYLVKLPGIHLKRALDILADMVVNPRLAVSDIERERTVILEEIKMYKDQPQSYVYELLDELLWPAQPLGLSVLGTDESVKGITREVLADYHRSRYVPSSIVISAAGAVEYSSFLHQVRNIFSSSGGGSPETFVPVRECQVKPQVKIFSKETEQTHLALGFHAFRKDHPLRHALSIMHIVLGANMSSRLFNELREKRGLAYEIGTALKRFHDTGAFVVHAGIDNRKVEEALDLIVKELSRIKHTLITQDEFRRAKEFYLGQMMLALEDTLDNMLWIGESVASLDKVYTLEEIVRQVRRLTRRHVREAAQRIFRDARLNLALIGPRAPVSPRRTAQLRLR
jgi:predicted Zn-dependent peptidase